MRGIQFPLINSIDLIAFRNNRNQNDVHLPMNDQINGSTKI